MTSAIKQNWPQQGFASSAVAMRNIWLTGKTEIERGGYVAAGVTTQTVLEGRFMPQSAGASGDGTANDQAAIEKVVAAAAAREAFAVVDLGGRSYRLGAPVEVSGAKCLVIRNGSVRPTSGFPSGRHLFEFTDPEHVFFDTCYLSGAHGDGVSTHVAGGVAFLGNYVHSGVTGSFLHGFTNNEGVYFSGTGLRGLVTTVYCNEFREGESGWQDKLLRAGDAVSLGGSCDLVHDYMGTLSARGVVYRSTSRYACVYRCHPYQLPPDGGVDNSGLIGTGHYIEAGAGPTAIVHSYLDNCFSLWRYNGNDQLMFRDWRCNTPTRDLWHLVIDPTSSNLPLRNLLLLDVNTQESTASPPKTYPHVTTRGSGLAPDGYAGVHIGRGNRNVGVPDQWTKFQARKGVSGSSVTFDMSSDMLGRPRAAFATLEASTAARVKGVEISGSSVTVRFSQSVSGTVHLSVHSSLTEV